MKKIISSPYSLKESLMWIVHYFNPSIKNETKISLANIKNGNISGSDFVISFVGDLMCLKNEGMVIPSPAVINLFRASDLVVINLEAPITSDKIEKNNSLLRFSFSSEFIESFIEIYQLQREKILFTIANNHMADYGKAGLIQTEKRLKDMGILFVGSLNEENCLALFTNKIRAGFISFSQWLNHDVFDEAIGIMRKEHLDLLNFDRIKIENNLDALIVLPHWSYEFKHFPNREIVDLAHALVNKGVDLIAAHHPHVLGPIEKIDHSVCHYSLGNFFPKTIHYATHLNGVWQVGLKKGLATNKLNISYEFHPFYVGRKLGKYYMYPMNELSLWFLKTIMKRLSVLYPENGE